MKKKIIFLGIIVMLAGAGFLLPLQFASAAPKNDAVSEIKAQIAEFLTDLGAIKHRFSRPAEPGSAEALARLDLLRQFQAKLQIIVARIMELRAQVPASKQIEKVEKGVTGDAVRGLQKFLKQFPEIYPEGLETGFFGNATENALKKFQQVAHIGETGSVDTKTKELINDLMQQGQRKSRPKIQDISPDYGSSGVTVTITGTGFTPANNAIFVRGKTVVTGLPSDDAGTVIRFVLPAEMPCPIWSSDETKKPQPKKACPVKVINTNGISNAKPFKMVMDAPAEPPPEPTPIPTAPVPPPPPLPAVDIKANGSDGPITIEYGTAATIIWSSTNASSCSVAPNSLTGIANSGITTGNLTASETYIVSCVGPGGSATDNVIVNISGSSLTASCSVSPVSALAGESVTWTAYPEGGTGSYSYSWSGTNGLSGDIKSVTPTYTSAGTKSASVTVTSGVQSVTALCASSVVVSLPPPVIDTISPAEGPVGTQITLIGKWFGTTENSINFAGVANAVMNLSSSDGTTLRFNAPETTNCAVTKLCSISITNTNGTSNVISFLLTQKVTPVVMSAPNGGEIFLQGPANTIRWNGGTNQVELLLVASSTVNNADPTNLIEGWISTAAMPDGSLTWDARTVCNREKTVCSEVSPGSYKIMALSEDQLKNLTIWNDAFEKPGNWDVSDQSFTIAPRPTISITVPNFGGVFGMGTYMTICWITGDLASKQVVIALVKDGVVVRILQTRTQYYATGGFEGSQLIPTDIPPGDGYKLRIYDPTDPTISDESDYPFTIVASSSYISLISPNGGNSLALGFKGYVNWQSMNIASQAVNINLFKGGTFYRTLASNVPQSYSWSTQAYSSGTFNTDVSIPADILTGNDYTLQIVDSANPALSDMSNAPFSIVRIPDTLTIDGRLIDYSTQQPIANFTYPIWDASGYRFLKTNADGQFTFTATTSTVLSRGYQFDFSPNCYETKWMGIYANKYGIYGWKWLFPLAGYSRDIQFLTGDAHFGDLPFWPMVNLKVMADTPVIAGSYFVNPLSGYAQQTSSGSYGTAHNLWKGMPLNIPALVRLEDTQGTRFYSPYVNYPSGSCTTKSLSYLDGVVKWEPYEIPIGLSYSPYSPIVGQKVSGSASASGGVSPYNFNLAYGILPTGVALSPSGSILGTTTAAGVFNSTVRVRDNNGVNDAITRSIPVRTTSGTLPPSISISYPYARVEYQQGYNAYISWYSNSIAGLSIKIDLLKAGILYRTLATYTQSTATGWFSTSALIPKDVPSGSDYTLRLSDASDPSVSSISYPVWIVGQTMSAYWNAYLSWTGAMTYSPTFNFTYATSTIPNLQSFKLYQKKPGETSKSLVATFSDLSRFATSPCTWNSLTSGIWYLYLNCYSASFTLSRSGGTLADFPAGTYEFEMTTVDKLGMESLPISTWKLVRLAIVVNSPTSAQSPVTSPQKLEWQIPSNWPTNAQRTFDLYVRLKSGAPVKNYYYAGPYSEFESTASKTYDGPILDPTQTYTLTVQKTFNATDPLTGQSISYLVASPLSSFWVK